MDALRQELRTKGYIQHIERIIQRLDDKAKDKFKAEDLPYVTVRLNSLHRLLNKTLPDARPRDDVVTFKMPRLRSVEDVPKAANAILKAVASGEITFTEAEKVSAVLERYVRISELVDIEQRLKKLEETWKSQL